MHQEIKELQGPARLAFVLALGAGLRWGEIISLTWEIVRKESVIILASKAKGRRARVVPTSKSPYAHLVASGPSLPIPPKAITLSQIAVFFLAGVQFCVIL
jgi:integrase